MIGTTYQFCWLAKACKISLPLLSFCDGRVTCRFRVDYALSREQKNKKGGKMYIQDKVEEYADEVFDLLDNGAHIYFCGLKGMMPGTCTFPYLGHTAESS